MQVLLTYPPLAGAAILIVDSTSFSIALPPSLLLELLGIQQQPTKATDHAIR
jgi:hypothetical protein